MKSNRRNIDQAVQKGKEERDNRKRQGERKAMELGGVRRRGREIARGIVKREEEKGERRGGIWRGERNRREERRESGREY